MTTSLQELVYFGTAWQLLQEEANTTPITLRGGWTNAQIIRSNGDNQFFAGIVEKRDWLGRVTDVVLAFAGAQGADAAQALALDQGIVLDEPLRAASIYEDLWNNPLYANAHIQVTGHSLGSVYSQFILAESIATHGAAATAARASFTGFGVAGGYDDAATYYGITTADMDPYFTGYSAINDPTIKKGEVHLGTAVLLPAFTGLDGVLAPFNLVAAHWPTTYISALGLPGWLTTAEQQQVSQDLSDGFPTAFLPGGGSIDPDYGNPGYTPLVVDGSAGNDTLRGMGGNDILVGGLGQDSLYGGAGNDRFYFENLADTGATAATADRIMDFASGDKIDLSGLDGNLTLFDNQDFTFIGGAAFTGAGQVRSWISGGNTWVAGNVDANTGADFMIRLDGVHHLTASDFVLTTDGVFDHLLEDLLPVPLDGLLPWW